MINNLLLQTGCRYLIKRLKPTVNNQYRRKLIALGLVPGAQFSIKKMAPLSGPVQLEIDGSLLSLRRHELCALLTLEIINS